MNSKIKILIADDEPDILEIIHYHLKLEGYQVICARNGYEAIDQSLKELPSMIILDVMMPGKSGIDACKFLRMQPQFKDTIILFLSAINDDATKIIAQESGSDDYITKPIRPKTLIKKINSLLITSGNKK